MTDTDPRAELFAALAELARRYPDWRFGQLVCNLADWSGETAWDAEDTELLAAARRHLAQPTPAQQPARI